MAFLRGKKVVFFLFVVNVGFVYQIKKSYIIIYNVTHVECLNNPYNWIDYHSYSFYKQLLLNHSAKFIRMFYKGSDPNAEDNKACDFYFITEKNTVTGCLFCHH